MKNLVMIYKQKWSKIPTWEYLKEYDTSALNKAYLWIAKFAEKHGFKFYMSRFEWYKGNKFIKAWVVEKGKWKQVYNIKPDFIYDKTSLKPRYIQYKKLFTRKKIILNPYFIEELCSDKLKTFKIYPKLTPRLYLVKNKSQLKKAMKKIRSYMAVLKPRAGSSAKGLIIDNKEKILKEKIKEEMVLQEFVDTTKGIPGLTKSVSDLRAIVINGKINHALVRVAKKGFVSNVSRGGRVKFLKKSQIPRKVAKGVAFIDNKLRSYKPRMYTTDFVFDENGEIWLIEMNSKPGLFIVKEAKMKKQLMDDLFRAIKNR